MKTSLMFVQDSEPLAGRKVRWVAGGKEVSCVSDGDGKIEVELGAGTYNFEVGDEDAIAKKVEIRDSGAHLLIVQMGRTSGPNTEDGIYAHYITKLGERYSFDSILGRGGMGVVIKAQDNVLHRPVAIKLLNEELRHNEEAQRIFLTEARSLATLSHPNLVGVHDVVTFENHVVMISEFVQGKSLEERLKAKGPMSQKVVVRVGIQLAQALAYMHKQGMIHRDIKPANMMVQKDGNLKVIDFGLARSLEDIANKGTRLRGTPAYMAPEQLVGDALTGSLDLYQTGVTLYELLTGTLPFQGGDITFAHVHREPDPIETHLPTINPNLGRLIMQCLAKDPKQRPASAELLAQDLTMIAAHIQGGATAELRSIGVQSQPTDSIPHLESAAAPPTTHNTETLDIRRDAILLRTSTPTKPARSKALLPVMAMVVLLCLVASVAIVLLWEGDAAHQDTSTLPLAASSQDPLSPPPSAVIPAAEVAPKTPPPEPAPLPVEPVALPPTPKVQEIRQKEEEKVVAPAPPKPTPKPVRAKKPEAPKKLAPTEVAVPTPEKPEEKGEAALPTIEPPLPEVPKKAAVLPVPTITAPIPPRNEAIKVAQEKKAKKEEEKLLPKKGIRVVPSEKEEEKDKGFMRSF